MKNEIENLLQKEMDRGNFLKHIGIAVIAMTGFASVMRALAGQGVSNKAVQSGFGSGTYGGDRSAN